MGGNIRDDIATKHQFNAQRIVTIYDLNTSPQELSDTVEDKIKTNIWKPNTAKTYLNSFKLYLGFLVTMNKVLQPTYEELDSVRLNMIQTNVLRISNSLSSMAAKDKKANVEYSNGINPIDLKQYFSSKRATEIESLLRKPVNNCRSNHTKVRNYLIMRIATSNPHRTGCISNMTLSEYKSSALKSGQFVVCVHRHKTVKTHGPAEVVIDQVLHKNIETFIKYFRPKTDKTELFVSWNGNLMEAGLIIQAFATELGHAGVEKK